SGDTLLVNGLPGVQDRFFITPTAAGAGTVTKTMGAQPAVTFSGVEQLRVSGQDADNDLIGEAGTAGPDVFTATPGATVGAWDVTGQRTGNGGFDFTPLSFTGFRGFLVFPELASNGGGAGPDTLVVNGTEGDDTF